MKGQRTGINPPFLLAVELIVSSGVMRHGLRVIAVCADVPFVGRQLDLAGARRDCFISN